MRCVGVGMAAALFAAAAWAQDVRPREMPANLDASRVTVDVKDARAGDVARKLAEEAGNRPAQVMDRAALPVTLALKDAPYWEAVVALRRAAAGRRDPADRDVEACLGPVYLRVYSITRVRHLRSVDPGGTRNYALLFGTLEWESRLPVRGMEVWLTSLVGSDGRERIDDYGTKGPRRVGYGAYLEGASENFDVYVARPPDDSVLKTCEGHVLMELAAGERAAVIDEPRTPGPDFAKNGDFSVRLDKSWFYGKTFVVTTTMRVEGDATWPPLGAGYGPTLVGKDGKARPGLVTTGAPSLRDKFEALAPPAADGAKRPAREFQISFRFDDLPPADGPWALRWVLPEDHRIRRLPFTLADVPLR